MVDEIRVDQPGVAAATSVLTGDASSISANARRVEQSLIDAAIAVRSGPLVAAIGNVVEKFSGQLPVVGTRVDALGLALGSTASTLMETDDAIAGTVRKVMQW